MHSGQYELCAAIPTLKVDGTKLIPLREYGHKGITYVEGRKSQPFSVMVKNNTANRVLAIVSIDGRDVVDGQPAHAGSRGYIIQGYSRAIVHGWRTSLEDINQFYFEEKSGSYAKASGGSEANCGVIACKIVGEKPKPMPVTEIIKEIHHHHHDHTHEPSYPSPWRPWPWSPTPLWCCTAGITSEVGSAKYSSGPPASVKYSSGTPTSAFLGNIAECPAPEVYDVAYTSSCSGGADTTTPDFTLGTGWGAAQKDKVTVEDFERGLELATLCLYYSDVDSLKKIGIAMDKEVAITAGSKLPQAFGEFCRPPGVS